MPLGSVALDVIVSAVQETVSENALVAVCPALSVTCTVNDEVPEVVGVPVILPADDSDSPAGKVPEISDQK